MTETFDNVYIIVSPDEDIQQRVDESTDVIYGTLTVRISPQGDEYITAEFVSRDGQTACHIETVPYVHDLDSLMEDDRIVIYEDYAGDWVFGTAAPETEAADE